MYGNTTNVALFTAGQIRVDSGLLTSILPVWASPGIWLGPIGHADLLSLMNDPSVCIVEIF